MLITGAQLIDMPIMGLQTGKELARTAAAVINPHNLTIIAYHVTGKHLDINPSYLRVADIREIGNVGIIIDSSDEFIETDDIVSDKKIYDIEFKLEGKPVIDQEKQKIGKVIEYTLDLESFVVQQLSVRRPLLKSFNDDELLIHRNQIVEVTDDLIVIKSSKSKVKAAIKSGHHYANPFRHATPQPETIDSK
jgi:uncharacterized protein YrrD